MQAREITPEITIADQPSAADLQTLRGAGYAGVVNLRHDGEPEQPLSTTEEGDQVRSLGMDYLHYGVGGAPLNPEGVNAVSTFLSEHNQGKVLVHCRKGGRAAALVLLHLARTQGWKPDEALEQGEALGLKVEGNLRGLVQQYLSEQAGG